MSAGKLIEDLILFYVKENYKHYLKKENCTKIPSEEIKSVVQLIYGDKKEHLKVFLKESLKDLMKEEYIGDLALLNLCNEIFEDDEVCINMLTREILNYQRDN
jgi:hypothetical protein|tara:strand:+ start:392 stop:700 length:309 start_codon:yes stop_codon:yes gene_type:complete